MTLTKTRFGLSLDTSGSMRCIAHAAAADYNSTIASIQTASSKEDQETLVSVVECGYGRTSKVRSILDGVNVNAIKPMALKDYVADGSGTPLFDSVGSLIEMFESSPDASNPEVSFLVMIITDGAENASVKYNARSIAEKIRTLNNTDRWTFVFRVPRGGSRALIQMGIPAGNILEWDQTEKGMAVSTAATQEAFTEYFTARSAGVKSTQKFYANLKEVTSKDVETKLTDISSEVLLWPVSQADDGKEIRPFVEKRLNGKAMLKGACFYQLQKQEKVQEYKMIVLRDKTTNAIYGGNGARQMLGLPSYGEVKLVPADCGNFDVFIQSTSINRKVTKGTQVLYWDKVGVAYK
jgi:hypothetical protein